MVKLDIGCGRNKAAGFFGIDQYAMDGVDAVCDLSVAPWLFKVDAKLPAEVLEQHYIPPPFPGGAALWTGNKLKAETVEEVRSIHFLEHLDGRQRVAFFNELFRVMKPGAKALIVVPHWASNRAYGDFTHQWPPVSEMLFYYVKREWRMANAPHTDIQWNPAGYECDFEATWGYALHPEVATKHAERQQYMLTFHKEAAQDTHITLTKPEPK